MFVVVVAVVDVARGRQVEEMWTGKLYYLFIYLYICDNFRIVCEWRSYAMMTVNQLESMRGRLLTLPGEAD